VRHLFALLLLAASPVAARELEGLNDALAARSLLGPEIWSRVVRINNTGVTGLEKRSPYPKTVYGLVFELSGILWFYCDADGTQSLSTRKNSLEGDKADPGPLFRAISDRFVSWSWVDDTADLKPPINQLPPNACLVECVALLRRRIAAGGEVGSPRLLLFYVKTPFGVRGHATLVFGLKDGLAAIEPDLPDRIVNIPVGAGRNPRSLSEYIRGAGVSSARVLPLDSLGTDKRPVQWAALIPAHPPAG
jgi:hypothetical protein